MGITFRIEGGKYAGKALSLDLKKSQITIGKQLESFPLAQITQLEIIQSKVARADDAIIFGALGALIAGPFGAAAGAALSGQTAPCTFILSTENGIEYICSGLRKAYEALNMRYRIVRASRKEESAPAGQ